MKRVSLSHSGGRARRRCHAACAELGPGGQRQGHTYGPGCLLFREVPR